MHMRNVMSMLRKNASGTWYNSGALYSFAKLLYRKNRMTPPGLLPNAFRDTPLKAKMGQRTP